MEQYKEKSLKCNYYNVVNTLLFHKWKNFKLFQTFPNEKKKLFVKTGKQPVFTPNFPFCPSIPISSWNKKWFRDPFYIYLMSLPKKKKKKNEISFYEN